MTSIRTAGAGTCGLVALAIVAAYGSGLPGQPASKDVRLTLDQGTSMAAALSPDGKVLAIDLLGALWTLAAEGGQARRILEDGYDARMPAWSPDGRRLAFQAYYRDTWHIWIVNADGTGLQEVTSGPFDDREPHWSPDGTRLAFSSDRSGNYDVWILTLAQRRDPPPDHERRERQHAGMVARWARDCLRLGPHRARRVCASGGRCHRSVGRRRRRRRCSRQRGHQTARPSPTCRSAERSAG